MLSQELQSIRDYVARSAVYVTQQEDIIQELQRRGDDTRIASDLLRMFITMHGLYLTRLAQLEKKASAAW